MYSEKKPLIPSIHRCHWCRKRLKKQMPIIAKEIFWGDGYNIDCYFCGKDCARAERIHEKKEYARLEKINKEIKGE